MNSSLFRSVGRRSRPQIIARLLLLGFIGHSSDSLAGELVAAPNFAAVVRHAPIINEGHVEGSIQQLLGEDVTLNGGALINGDFFVPGTPSVRTNGKPVLKGLLTGTGAVQPSNYQVTLNGAVALRYLRLRADPLILPAVLPPPAPVGTRDVALNSPSVRVDDFSTVRDLSLDGNSGLVAVPPGTYRNLTANGKNGFIFGISGAVEPAIYNLQTLTLNGNPEVRIAGPVVLTLADRLVANGTLGVATQPLWLKLNLATADLTINGGCALYALVMAPSSTVTLNGNSRLVGSVACDRLIMNGGSQLKAVTNQRPRVDAGPDQIISLPNNSVVLNGAATDDGLPMIGAVAVSWALISGPGAVTFGNAGIPITTATFEKPGVYRLRLAANDSLLAASDDATITVHEPLIVNAGPDQTIHLPNTATLSGIVPDKVLASGNPWTVLWSKVSGPGALAFGNANTANTTATFSEPGVYVLRLTVNDAVADSSDEITVTVQTANEPPAVRAGINQTITFPEFARLVGTVTDDALPAGSSLAISWSQVSGPGIVTFGNAGAAVTTAHFSSPGIYRLRLAADDSLATTSDLVAVTVNQAPTVDAGADQIVTLPNHIATLRGVANDDGLPIGGSLAVTWSKVSGPGVVAFGDAASANTIASFTASGRYVLRLTANDSLASSGADMAVSVLRTNQPPSVDAGPDQTNTLSNRTLLAGMVGDDGQPAGALSVLWSLDSGQGSVTFSNANAAVTTATFSELGTFVLRLTANDSVLTVSDTTTVTIAPPSTNQPPAVDAGPDQTIGLTSVARLSGRVSDDGLPSPNSLSFTWSKVSGPGTVTFSGGTTSTSSLTPIAAFSERGAYVLQLTASDAELSTTDDVTINVYPSNLPPVVNAGPDQTVTLPVKVLNGSIVSNSYGKIVVAHDEWVLSDTGFGSAPTTTNFVRNVAAWFTGGHEGNFLAYSANFSLTGPQLAAALSSAGHNWTVSRTVDFSLPNLLQYDGIFLAGEAADNAVLIDYVKAGGNVYLSAGTGVGGSVAEAARWNTFLDAFGLSFNPAFDGVAGTIPVTSAHPLFKGVTALYSNNGNSVSELKPADPYTDVLEDYSGNGLFAVYETPRISAALAGTVTDDDLPGGGTLSGRWHVLSGPTPVTFAGGTSSTSSLTTSVDFTFPGLYRFRLTADDSDLSSVDDVDVAVVGNEAPSVNAGPDQTIGVSETVTLTGSAADDGILANGNLTVYWLRLSGPGTVTFGNTSAASTTAAFSAAGTYVLRLTAGDSQMTSSDDVTINVTVTQSNAAPSVNAGTFQSITLPTNTVTLAGFVTDDGLPPGSALAFAWSQVGGPGVVIFADANATNTTASFSAAGFYTLRLTAADSHLASSADVSISVNAPGNQRPTTDAGPDQTITLPAKAILIGRATDDGFPSSGPVRTFWTMTSGPGTVTFGNSTNRATTSSFSVAGSYVLQFKACDDFSCASDDLVVVVNPGSGTPPGSPGNQAPIVDAGLDQTVVLPALSASLNGSIADDGLPADSPLVAWWIKVSGPGTVAFDDNTALSTLATFSVMGSYVLRLYATDIEFIRSDDVVIHVAPPVNQPPAVNAGPDQTNTLGRTIALNGSLTDDGLPVGGALSVTWSKVSGPGTVTFVGGTSSTSALTTAANFSATGAYILRLTVTDSQLTSADDVTITVNLNQAPTVSAGPDQTITLPDAATLNGAASDDGLPAGTLSTTWSKVSGPGAVTFLGGTSSTSSLTTSASFDLPGTYILRLTADDSQNTSSDDLIITVNPAVNQAPSVDAGPDQTITLPESAMLTRTVTDDALPFGTLAISWSKVSGPAPVAFSMGGMSSTSSLTTAAAFTAPGTYVLRLTATDSALTGSDDVTITAIAPIVPVPPPPVAELTAPLDTVEITAPTNIIGTASSSILESYQLQRRLKTGDDSENWITFATGLTPVANGVLGTFDPTLLLNGIHEVRLVANDTIGRSVITPSVPIVVAGNMKVGNFTLSFTDLSIPVAGIPIQVVRTYDSRDKRPGDFGVGWNLDVKNIRLQKNRNLGRGWEETSTAGLLPTFCLDPLRARIVTITFPNGKVYKFQTVPMPACQFGFVLIYPRMSFMPLPGTTGTLTPVTGDELVAFGNIPGFVDFYDFNALLDPNLPTDRLIFDPTLFQFTTPDGYVYEIDEKAGLKSMIDPNGNTLRVTPNGILHSSGKSVVFERDASGRITGITDPAGNRLIYTNNTTGDLIGFQDREDNLTTFTYDGAHGLLAIRDPRGIEPARNEYDADGRLIGHTDAFGKTITYSNNLNARQEIIADRLGNQTLHEYDERGNVVRTIDALGGVTQSTYDRNDNLLTQTDPLGRTTLYTYDGLFNRTSVTDPLGNVTRFTYSAQRKVTSAIDARGSVTTNSYDANGKLTSTRDPLGNVTGFTYNSRGLPTSMTDALGQMTHYEYDAFGNLGKAMDALGHETTFTADANGNLLTQTATRMTPTGVETLVTRFEYDRLNRVTNTVFPNGSTIRTIYNAIGKPAITVDQLGRQTSYDYDELGRLTRTIHPDGVDEGANYDAEGRRIASTNRLGRVTSYSYDALGRLTRTQFPDGATTTNYLDPAGQLIVSTDPRGNSTFYGYDAAGRSIAVTNALGQVNTSAYDPVGNLITSTDALGRPTRYVYDALNRRVQTVFADATTQTTTHDALGRRIAETDQDHVTTWFGYDALGRLTSVTNALGYVTRYAYDELGRQTAQTDANQHTTTFEYDQLGRRTRRTLPGGQIETYGYNAIGSLTGRTDFNGRTTTFQYDVMNRLLQKVPDPAGSPPEPATPLSYTYNALGQRTTMTDASGVTLYAYDNRNRLITKTKTWGGTSSTSSLTYSYDANANVTSIQSSNPNGAAVSYTYDALNRLMEVNDPHLGQTTYTYDPIGNLQSYTLPNAVTTVHQYDSLNRLTDLTILNAQLSTLNRFSYALGPAGNRTAVTEWSGRQVSYAYDNLYRLTRETIGSAGVPPAPFGVPPNGTMTYTYDAVGNRLARNSSIPGILTSSHGYDANDRLTSDQYDANGNTRFAFLQNQQSPIPQAVHDQYDFENRLITRQTTLNSQPSTLNFTYDGDGNRVRKTLNGVTTLYLVDDLNPTGYPQVLEELTVNPSDPRFATPAVTRVYAYGHALLSQDRLNGAGWTGNFYGYDGHGNVRFLTDALGQITDTYDYDAFGNLIAQTGATPNNYLFAGEQFDPDLGLYYLRARYHNPGTGRFWTMDALEGFGEDPQSLHRYAFNHNNPVNRVDPSGNFSLTEGLTAGGIGAATQGIIGMLMRGVVAASYGLNFKESAGAAFDSEDISSDAEEGFIAGFAGYGVGKAIAAAAKPVFYAVRQGAPFLLNFTQRWAVRPLTQLEARLQTAWITLKNRLLGAKRGTGWSVNAPEFFSVPNKGGGRVWLSTTEIDQNDFAKLVTAGQRKGRVTILTGTHGGSGGNLKFERALFNEDLAAWADQTLNVKIIDIAKLSPRQLMLVLNRENRVICAWCWSANNPVVQATIGAGP